MRSYFVILVCFAVSVFAPASFARETNGELQPDAGKSTASGSCKLIGNVFYSVSFAGGHNKVIPLDHAMNTPSCPSLRNYDAVKQAYKDLMDKYGLSKLKVASSDQGNMIDLIRLAQKKGLCKCFSSGSETLCTDSVTKEKTYFSISCRD